MRKLERSLDKEKKVSQKKGTGEQDKKKLLERKKKKKQERVGSEAGGEEIVELNVRDTACTREEKFC